MSKRRSRTYSTDRIAQNIWRTLIKDFRTSEGNGFCEKAEEAFNAGMDSYREYSYPQLGYVPARRFKRYAQLETLLKKYRFANDVYSDDQLQERTLTKYFDEQERLAVVQPDIPEIGFRVAQRARKIAKRILGEYKPEDTIKFAKFGKKSSIGCPLNLAYIDEKLSNVKAFTGSSQCSRWFFNSILPKDELLKQLVDKMPLIEHPENLEHESLALVNVPKSWKTFRTITPLTLLSLFYSYGVGQQVTDRLAETGLDIRKLQQRHRKLVKKFSISRTHATADLSAASDSLVSENLNRILPRKWYCALKKAMTHQVQFERDGILVRAYTASVLPMGNGFTFPVETLVFYSIIKAIGELTEVDGLFSVYGDDLIYPSRLHKYVREIFPQLKLVLNLDKTFVKAPFRESCGSDYYRGCDVRPFFLQGESAQLTRTQYISFLYKTYNGLSRRWHEEEIRSTLYYLLQEIAQVDHSILRVPPGYPDTAGIKVESPGFVPLGVHTIPWSPISVLFSQGTRWYSFRYYLSTSLKRAVKSIVPYYWLALQGLDDDPKVGRFWETDYSYLSDAPAESISWKKSQYVRFYNRKGKRIRKVLVKYSPEVSSRMGVKLQRKLTKTGSITDWI